MKRFGIWLIAAMLGLVLGLRQSGREESSRQSGGPAGNGRESGACGPTGSSCSPCPGAPEGGAIETRASQIWRSTRSNIRALDQCVRVQERNFYVLAHNSTSGRGGLPFSHLPGPPRNQPGLVGAWIVTVSRPSGVGKNLLTFSSDGTFFRSGDTHPVLVARMVPGSGSATGSLMPPISRFDSIRTESGSEAPRLGYILSLGLETTNLGVAKVSSRDLQDNEIGTSEVVRGKTYPVRAVLTSQLYSDIWGRQGVAMPSNMHIEAGRKLATPARNGPLLYRGGYPPTFLSLHHPATHAPNSVVTKK